MQLFLALLLYLTLHITFAFRFCNYTRTSRCIKLYEALVPSQSSKVRTGSENYYDILGVPPNASMKLIKEAHRRRVKECHPDSCLSSDALDRYYELENAYSILSDPGKRSTYDQKIEMENMVSRVNNGEWMPAMATFSKIIALHVALPLVKGAASLTVSGIKLAVSSGQEIIRNKGQVAKISGATVQNLTESSHKQISVQEQIAAQKVSIISNVEETCNPQEKAKIRFNNMLFRSEESVYIHQLIYRYYINFSNRTRPGTNQINQNRASSVDSDEHKEKNDSLVVHIVPEEIHSGASHKDISIASSTTTEENKDNEKIVEILNLGSNIKLKEMKRHEMAARIRLLKDHLSRDSRVDFKNKSAFSDKKRSRKFPRPRGGGRGFSQK